MFHLHDENQSEDYQSWWENKNIEKLDFANTAFVYGIQKQNIS